MKIKGNKELKWHIIIILFIIMIIYPLIFTISTSFKTMNEAVNNILPIIPDKPTIQNYLNIINKIPIFQIIFNTFFIATIVTLFKVFTSILASYSFVFFNYKGKNILYFLLISTIFIPFTVTMVPNYLTISAIGIKNSLWGVIFPQCADALGIFLLRQHMKGIPYSLIEVAKLEKTPHFRIMRELVVPMIRPAILSTGIIFFINSWNEFVWPMLVLKDTKNFTLSIALQMFVSSEGGTEFTVAMAISVITMIVPLILYAFCQKHIINTFSNSGIKG